MRSQALHGTHIAKTFNVQPQCGHALVVEKRHTDLCKAELRLIACGDKTGQRQRSLLHADVQRHVG